MQRAVDNLLSVGRCDNTYIHKCTYAVSVIAQTLGGGGEGLLEADHIFARFEGV
jgi:hypothetical protein